MPEVITQSIQNYLKHIYELNEHGGNASTNDLALRLNVAPASVTGMLQRLANSQPPLVVYKKHQGAMLTKNGEKAALEVIRHHRLLETWLVQTLGYAWDEVHEEAEKLEHVISENFAKRIAAALGNPLRDPHGELIPSEDLKMPPDESAPLSSLRPKQIAVIQRVNSQDANFLRHLNKMCLIPNTEVTVIEHSPFDNNITIEVGGKSHVLGLNITTKIFVGIKK